MENKMLGKIEKAEFGMISDRDYLFGLIITLKSGATGVISDHVANMNIAENERIVEISKFTYNLLKDAKVTSVDKLVGVAVEITFNGNVLESFRILTEVL